jgi:hypothetical protein
VTSRMRRFRPLGLLAAVAAALVFAASPEGVADSGGPYRDELRVEHIEKAARAIGETPPPLLQQGLDYARTLARGACSAGAQRLRVECLMVAVRRYCRDLGGPEAARCPDTMDVLVSNVLADERLIPVERRYQIVRENGDYRAALAVELWRIQGALAVDFRLHAGESRDTADLAAKIDHYCLAASSDEEARFSYQTCVSSLVWFIEEAPAVALRGEPK